MNKKLLVIIPDRLSNLLKKGEIIERYYNPGDYFEEVHFLLTNDDLVEDLEEIQKAVGKARFFIHNLPADKKLFIKTLGFRPILLKPWINKGLTIIKEINPDIIRCYGNRINAYLAYHAKIRFNIKYIISMHTNPDDLYKVDSGSIIKNIYTGLYNTIETISLLKAEEIVIVYRSIEAYLEKRKIHNYRLIYNVINPSAIVKKKNYFVDSNNVNLISVGRQIPGKNPINIIRAIKDLTNIKLTLVGTGLLHDSLKDESQKLGLTDRVIFIEHMNNTTLCNKLENYDIFVANCDYSGVPKAVIEPLLSGLPVIINEPKYHPVPEYEDADYIRIVDGSIQSYKNAINSLVDHELEREKLAKNAEKFALKHWNPQINEEHYVKLYDEIIKRG